tara:strand:- start:2247 stop:2774 length:528 start_codon:yes stop_codon:yes gene_type:complete
MYFEKFPVIPYDAEGTYDFKDVTNLLRRVALRANVRTNALLYDTYDVRDGETPESIADKLYGDTNLHYIVMLVNNITDRYHDWPMNGAQFLHYINEKYSDPDAVHHYEIEQTSGDTSIKIDIGTDNTNYSSATAITNFDYEQKLQDEKRKIRLLDPQYASQFVEEFENLMGEEII